MIRTCEACGRRIHKGNFCSGCRNVRDRQPSYRAKSYARQKRFRERHPGYQTRHSQGETRILAAHREIQEFRAHEAELKEEDLP